MLLWLKFTAEIHTLNIIQFKINYAPHISLSEYSPQFNSDEESFPLSLFTITPPLSWISEYKPILNTNPPPFHTKSIGQN